jgi:thiosulfate/3-mercaptopyruvate sulfurtransferase
MKSILRWFSLTAGLLLASASWASQPLLSPAELRALQGNPNLRVIDIRDGKSYGANHIPGALSAPYGSWRGPASNPGELPDINKLTTQVQKLGLSPETHAVVVSSGADDTDFGASARVYWTLKVLGLKQLSVLNGGMKAWAAAGLPQEAQVANVGPSAYVPKLDTSLIATKEDVRQQIAANKVNLIDARPAEFYSGDTRHAAAKVPGTLKGAVNFEHAQWFAPGTSQLLSGDAAKAVAAKVQLDDSKETVSFCNTGHWAATNWFALSEVAGKKNVKLYAGSMVEWSADPRGLPMDNVPNRAKQLLIDAKFWAEKNLK